MREISLYEMKPVYLAGEIDNLNALKEKLEADTKVFSQIEQDYNQSQTNFIGEYITAKKNHLKVYHRSPELICYVRLVTFHCVR